MRLRSGDRVDQWHLIRPLGRGGSSEVWIVPRVARTSRRRGQSLFHRLGVAANGLLEAAQEWLNLEAL
jgi:hypothetical protein